MRGWNYPYPRAIIQKCLMMYQASNEYNKVILSKGASGFSWSAFL